MLISVLRPSVGHLFHLGISSTLDSSKSNFAEECLYPVPKNTPYVVALLITFRRILCPSSSFRILSFKKTLYLLVETGSHVMASISESGKPPTAAGENIFSSPRTMWRSMT